MTGFLRDHTKFKRISLGGRRQIVLERSVYGPKSKSIGVTLGGNKRVLTMHFHRFQLNGTDN